MYYLLAGASDIRTSSQAPTRSFATSKSTKSSSDAMVTCLLLRCFSPKFVHNGVQTVCQGVGLVFLGGELVQDYCAEIYLICKLSQARILPLLCGKQDASMVVEKVNLIRSIHFIGIRLQVVRPTLCLKARSFSTSFSTLSTATDGTSCPIAPAGLK